MNYDNYIIFNVAYITIFALLGILILSIHLPNKQTFRNYRSARRTLGSAFFTMTFYCTLRVFLHYDHGDYGDFWLLILFSFIFSWLNYATFLFLLDTPRYKTKIFIKDGLYPISLMAIIGVAGTVFHEIQKTVMILFGCLFAAKCLWMFYKCETEYQKCLYELDNFYDNTSDIQWIRTLVWLTFILSISTLLSFYVPPIHYAYDFAAPLIYVYMVIKIINFVPKKIDDIRKDSADLEAAPQPVPTEKKVELPDKIGNLVKQWVDSKKFCRADLTIKDVAKEIGTNQNYLSIYINRTLGMTFQVWLNTLRIQESQKILIEERNLSIEEVGIRVGFPQSYNFSRWFRIVTSTTPFQYRKSNSEH